MDRTVRHYSVVITGGENDANIDEARLVQWLQADILETCVHMGVAYPRSVQVTLQSLERKRAITKEMTV